MDFDAFVKIVSLAVTVISYVGYRYLSENVKLTYKDQRVGVGTKKKFEK